MRESRLLKNAFWGFAGQFAVIILGIVIPRIMITSYGSDANGLLSTVTQIFTYMALLEAGIGQAARNALYKPILENDREGISCVLATAQQYFRKITIYYGAGVLLLSIILPYILKSNVEEITIFGVVLFEGLSGVVSFFFVESFITFLTADGRGYVNNGINVLTKILGYLMKIVMASLGMNIIFVQAAYFIITLVKVFIYRVYLRKRYSWITFNQRLPKEGLPDRKAYVITEIGWTIFSSTDMIVLSIFAGTKLASVYAVYNMIFTNLNVLLNAVYTSVNYVLGQAYHKDIKKYEMVHDAFVSVFLGSMTVLMAVSYVLCMPFIQLYTNGIADTNYIYEELPLLFCVVQILSWSRYVGGNLTGIAGYARETSWISLLEAGVNVILSIVLVSRFGIIGVLMATVIALPLKVLWCIYISDRKVMRRSFKRTVIILGANYLFFGLVVLIRYFRKPVLDGYGDFAIYAVVLTVLFAVIGMGVNAAANPQCLQIIRNFIRKKR